MGHRRSEDHDRDHPESVLRGVRDSVFVTAGAAAWGGDEDIETLCWFRAGAELVEGLAEGLMEGVPNSWARGLIVFPSPRVSSATVGGYKRNATLETTSTSTPMLALT